MKEIEMGDKIYKTTRIQFELFIKECEYWLDKLSLREWAVYYKREYLEDNTMAQARYRWAGRMATLCLAKEWGGTKPCNFGVCKAAFHEVCEVLLGMISVNADIDARPTQRDDNEACVHAVIRRLEHTLWLPDYNRRNKK